MDERLHFYYPWSRLDRSGLRAVLREFLDNGRDRFVISDTLMEQMLADDGRREMLAEACRDMKARFTAVHAPWGAEWDPNLPTRERRPGMIRDHIRAMGIAAEFGCRNYVMHMGSYFYCYEKVPLDILRPLLLESLEKLLPEAEKLGMVIAVENSFEKANSARELMEVVRHFEGHSAIGVCYDTGHANCMASFGKDKNLYPEWFRNLWWEEGIIWEDHALETLRDYIVTCHIHDNTGYSDLHSMPFDGVIDWAELVPKLLACPRINELQTEVSFDEGSNWAGQLPAPPGGYSVRRLTETFTKLGL